MTTTISGTVYVKIGESLSDISVSSSGLLNVEGGSVKQLDIQGGGNANVWNPGANASGITIEDGGLLSVSNGGELQSVTLDAGSSSNSFGNAGASLVVDEGGTASSVIVNDQATVTVGGTITVSGQAVPVRGGTLDTLDIKAGGSVQVGSGGLIKNPTVEASGTLYVAEQGTVSGGTNYGLETVAYYGQVYDTTVGSGGKLLINDGGVTEATVQAKGEIGVFGSAATANSVVLQDGGVLTAREGTVNDLTLEAGSTQNFYGSYGAQAYVGSAATVNNASVGKEANIVVGGEIPFNGQLSPFSGGTLSGGSVMGSVSVANGGAVENIAVQSGAIAYVSAAGTLTDSTIAGLGVVTSGGAATGLTVNQAGELLVSDGTVTGVSVEVGAEVGAVGDAAVVNSLTLKDGGFFFAKGGTVNDLSLEDGQSVNKYGTYGAEALVTNETIANDVSVGVGASVSVGGKISLNGHTTTFEGGTVNRGSVRGTISVANGGAVENIALQQGGVAYVSSGGTLSDSTIEGVSLVTSGGTAADNIVNTNGLLDVQAGGAVNTVTVHQKGSFAVDGGSATDVTINDGGLFALAHGGLATNVTLDGGTSANGAGSTGALGYVISTATLKTVMVGSGASLVAGGLIEGQSFSGGQIQDVTVLGGGSATVGAGGVISDSLIQDGGSLTIGSEGSISGTVTLANGAQAVITTTAGGIIDLQGNTNVGLVISGHGNPTTTIQGFSGINSGESDGITFSDIQASDVTGVTYPDNDHVLLALKDGSSVTLNIIGVSDVGYTLSANANGDLVYEVCFLSDTMIKTPDGELAVQNISAGDYVQTYCNGQEVSKVVVWAGKAHTRVRVDLSDDEAGYPVRILRDAISPGVPSKDLLITAEHCLFFEGNFIPARMLVNGRSIFYDKTITSYDYYHIETDEHSVIIADGMLTESYLDTGNRRAFTQNGNVFQFGGTKKSWETDAAAPLTVFRDIVESLYRRIEARAVSQNISLQSKKTRLTEDSDLHLVTDTGLSIQPLRKADGNVMFMIPGNVQNVRIVSNASRPCDAIGPFVDDRRLLGVLIGKITLFDSGKSRALTAHLETEVLSGWSTKELMPLRWTDGNAVLSLGKRDPSAIGLLAVQVVAEGPYTVNTDESAASYQIA